MNEIKKKVYQSAIEHFDDMAGTLVENYGEICESPIEVLFASAFSLRMQICDPGLLAWDHNKARADQVSLTPQFLWKKYRIDFAVRLPDILGSPIFFIECDGHNFHERTKEQAARDRAKDRAIQTAGISVLRFTGSELYRDVNKCVDEVYDFMWRIIGDAQSAMYARMKGAADDAHR